MDQLRAVMRSVRTDILPSICFQAMRADATADDSSRLMMVQGALTCAEIALATQDLPLIVFAHYNLASYTG